MSDFAVSNVRLGCFCVYGNLDVSKGESMTGARSATRISILVMLLFSLGGLSAFAQFSSGIEGTVTDQSGAVVPGAKVTITDTRLGVAKTTATNNAGYFRIGSIAASTYTVQIQASAFKTWEQQDLTLQVGEIRTLAPVLELGPVSANVRVSAAVEAVDLASAKTGATISETTVEETPLTGQNIFGLAALAPGITGSGVNSADNFTNEYAININAAGLRQEQNGYMIDGAYTDFAARGGGSAMSPNPEIVQSMDVLTNNFDAQKGRNGGATVQVFTKSGTNDLHGTVDYYFLNNSLSARTEFESTVPTFQRNEYSGTVGGPIIKNKLFLYGAIDVLRSSVTNSGQTTVETQALDSWAESNLPNNLATQILQAAPPQHFPTANLETVSQLESSTPGHFAPPANIPGTLDAVGTANYAYAAPKNAHQWMFRVDDYVNERNRLYFEAMRTHYTQTSASAPRFAMNIPQTSSSDFVNLDWTHTFSGRLLNDMGAHLIRPQGANLPVNTLAIPYINVTGIQGFGNWGSGNYVQTTVGWRDVMTATIKTHTLKFGGDAFNIREIDDQTSANDRPTYSFANLLDFIQDEAISENAAPINLSTGQQFGYFRSYRETYIGAFIQDDWKVKPRLTLNLGVRYDAMPSLFDILSPKLTQLTLGQGTTREEQIANAGIGPAPNDHVVHHNVYAITPRVGFAWDPRGGGKTSVRGGFGLFSDQPAYLHMTDITANNLPYAYYPSISVLSGAPTPTFQECAAPVGFNQSCPLVVPSSITFDPRGGIVGERATLGGIDPNYKFTQVEGWSLSVQRQLQSNLLLEVNYSGSAAHHLPIYTDINNFPGDLIVNDGSSKRLNPSFGEIAYASSNGNSIGNYGSVTLTRRASKGLALRGIYTYGKALDVFSTSASLVGGAITTYTSIGGGGGPLSPSNGSGSAIIQSGNFNAQRGRADFDIRQQFSADGTWTVPNPWSSRVARNVLGGWQFGGVWILQSGLPFTVYTSAPFVPVYNLAGCPSLGAAPCQVVGNTGGDYNADGFDYDVPNAPAFGNHLKGQSKKNFLNGLFPVSAFPLPALGQEGNLGRNTYDQPGYNNLDLTCEKFFSTPWFHGEKLKLEARGEVFNLFNRVNLIGVESDLSNPAFGHSTNQLPARSLQFHIRAVF